MKPEQLKALLHSVNTEEGLGKAWANPRVYNFDKKKVTLVTLLVVKENERYKWSVSVRLQNMNKKNIKEAKLFTAAERLRIRMILENELSGVGQELGAEEFDSRVAMHLNKELTGEELGILMAPHIAGH